MTTTVTKKELIDRIAAATGQKRLIVKEMVQTFLEQVIMELGKGHRLEFRDFGVFEIKQRAPRTAQNPKTLERVEVPAKRTVKFKVGRLMKQCLDDPEGAIAAMAAAMAEQHEGEENGVVVTGAASASSAPPSETANGARPRTRSRSSAARRNGRGKHR